MTSAKQQPFDDQVGPDASRSDLEAELAGVQQAINEMVDMMVAVLDARVKAVATNIGEILGGQIVAIREQDPAWSIEWQADWARSQMDAIRATVDTLKAELPGDLRAKVGTGLVDDHSEMLDARITALAETINVGASRMFDRELPAAMAFLRERDSQLTDDVPEVGGDRQVAPHDLSMRSRIALLHVGQLVMVLVGALIGALFAGAATFIAWASGSSGLITGALAIASGLLAGFAIWSLWVWFGARRARPATVAE